MVRVKFRCYDYRKVEQIRLPLPIGALTFTRSFTFFCQEHFPHARAVTRQRCDMPGASLGLQPEAS